MFNNSFSSIDNNCQEFFDDKIIGQNYLLERHFDYSSIFEENKNLKNGNSSLIIPDTLNCITIDNTKKEVGKKRNKSCDKKHDKFADDNIRRKIKHLVLESLFNFINKKIKEIYKNYPEIKLLKINKKQKSEAKISHDKELLKKSLYNIFSVDITRKYRHFPSTQNKAIINFLKNDEKYGNPVYFRKLFNLSFLESLKHYRGTENISVLKGLEGIEMIKDKFKGDKYYLENIEYYIMNFETIINNKKEKKFIKKEDNKI